MPMSESIKKRVEFFENGGKDSDQGKAAPESNSDAAVPTNDPGNQTGDQSAPTNDPGNQTGDQGAPTNDPGNQTGDQSTKSGDQAAKPDDNGKGSGSQDTSDKDNKPKFGRTFADRSQYKDRNKFIQKEYVDTYAAEKDYDKETAKQDAKEEDKAAKLGAIENAAKADPEAKTEPEAKAEPETKAEPEAKAEPEVKTESEASDKTSALNESLEKLLKSGELNKLSDDANAPSDTKNDAADDKTKTVDENASKAGDDKNDINSIITDSGIISDSEKASDDAAAGKVGEKHANNLAIAADTFGAAGEVTNLAGDKLSKAGVEEKVTGKISGSLNVVGSILGMSGHADRVRRQNQAISKLKGNVKDNAQNKDEKRKSKLSKDYIRAARAKRFSSGFETGAGVANVIAGGLGLAGEFVNDKTLSAIFGAISSVIGMMAKGLSFLGGALEKNRNKKNKDAVVKEYIDSKVKNVKQHGTTEQEGQDLSDTEKENIVIARMGIKVEKFDDEGVREQSKDEIFKRIGLKRVKQARQEKEFLATIGLKESASDDAILEALGYGD